VLAGETVVIVVAAQYEARGALKAWAYSFGLSARFQEGIGHLHRRERNSSRSSLLVWPLDNVDKTHPIMSEHEIETAFLQKNFSCNGSEVVFRVLCEVGLASLICRVACAGILTVYSRNLNLLREKCRQLVTRPLESQPGKPHLPMSPERKNV
jgi:hypothetical protein